MKRNICKENLTSAKGILAVTISLCSGRSWNRYENGTSVRENASFGRSDDVTILSFRQVIAREIWALRETLLLGSIAQYLGLLKSHYKP